MRCAGAGSCSGVSTTIPFDVFHRSLVLVRQPRELRRQVQEQELSHEYS